jgi:hypothetical protein
MTSRRVIQPVTTCPNDRFQSGIIPANQSAGLMTGTLKGKSIPAVECRIMLFPNRVPSGNPAATPPCCSRIHAPRAAGPSSGRARDTGRAPARRLAGVRWRGWPGVRGGPVVGTRWAASLRPPTASGLTGWTRGRSARSGWLPVAFAALSRDWSLIDSGKLPEAIRSMPFCGPAEAAVSVRTSLKAMAQSGSATTWA